MGSGGMKSANGRLIRTLTRVRLFDVSAVSFPAYEETDLSLRSAILAEGRRAVGKAGWSWEVEADLRRRKLDLIVRAMDPSQRVLYEHSTSAGPASRASSTVKPWTQR
jgi:hypothetical protein